MVGRVKWLISSSLKLIDSPLKAVRALLTKNDPIRLSQEACFEMKMNLKRFGCLAKQFTIAWERWTERLSKVMGRPSLKVKSCLFNDRRLVEPFQVRPETTPVIFILRIIQYVVDHERVKQPPPEELEGFMNLHQDSVNAFSFKELNRPLKSL